MRFPLRSRATAVAVCASLGTASAANAHTLTTGEAKARIRAFSTAEVVRIANRGIEVNRFTLGSCSRVSDHVIRCGVTFRRMDGQVVCRERVEARYRSESAWFPRARRISGCY